MKRKSNFCSIIITLFLVSEVTSIKDTVVTLSLTAPQTHNTLPAAYQGETFTLNLNIQLQEDYYNPLTARIVLPHDVTNTPDCQTHTSGIEFQCVGTVSYFDVYAEVVDLSTSSFTMGSNIRKADPSFVFDKFMDIDGEAIVLDFGNISTISDGLAQSNADELTFSVALKIIQDYHGMATYPFSASVTNGDVTDPDHVTNTSDAELAFVGPDLHVTMSSTPSSNIEANQSIQYYFIVQHDDTTSTETATEAQVST